MISLARSIPRLVPGKMMPIITVWLCWVLLAPPVFDRLPKAPVQHLCPSPTIVHSVICPPPHMVTSRKVKCLKERRVDLCSAHQQSK